jgi:hypothetical protein
VLTMMAINPVRGWLFVGELYDVATARRGRLPFNPNATPLRTSGAREG